MTYAVQGGPVPTSSHPNSPRDDQHTLAPLNTAVHRDALAPWREDLVEVPRFGEGTQGAISRASVEPRSGNRALPDEIRNFHSRPRQPSSASARLGFL
jgi:hypothetical protein